MLCRVYSDEKVQVREAGWRRRAGPPASAARVHRTTVPGESAQLAARVEELNEELARRTKEAWDQGVKAGDAAARKALDEQVRAAVSSLAKTIGDVASARADVIRSAEADTVRLSMEIARRVLHRELSIDPGAVGGLIRAALDKLRWQEVYRVRVHPDQEKAMRTSLEHSGRESAIEVVVDASQAPGGVVFDISRGTLDASVDTQLREIENGLADELKRRS